MPTPAPTTVATSATATMNLSGEPTRRSRVGGVGGPGEDGGPEGFTAGILQGTPTERFPDAR